MTPTERFTEREEAGHAMDKRIATERRFGEQRQPMTKHATYWRDFRRYYRVLARINVTLVRERFEEYGNISDSICG